MNGSKVAFLLLALLALAAGCGEGGSSGTAQSVPPILQSSNTPAPLLLTPPAGSIYLGIYVNPSNVPSPPPSLIAGVESQIGRHFALSMHYHGFFDSFPGSDELADIANGRIPFESWDCDSSNAQVASGDEDGVIRTLADTIKAFSYPIFLRYEWEMNLQVSPTFHAQCYDKNTDLPDGFFSPSEYILAWRRIRMIFAQEGVGNVVWVWNPSGANNASGYYPGAGEVDWVGFDYYDTANISAVQTYTQAYKWLSVYNKPILIGETAATVPEQPSYFLTLAQVLKSDFPLISAYSYYDAVNKRYGANYTWALSPSTIGDFTTFATDPYVSAMPTVSPIP